MSSGPRLKTEQNLILEEYKLKLYKILKRNFEPTVHLTKLCSHKTNMSRESNPGNGMF